MATTDVLVHINMNGNEIQNVLAQKLATAPSNPSAGQFYYNTTDNTLYVYDGTSWLNALAQGTTYSEGSGIDITSNTISIDLATGANAGNVTLTTTNGLSASAPSASTSTAGLIEIATDAEVLTGTDTSRAVTPKQLAGKVDKLSTIPPTAGTYPKVTINSDGLVTSGGSLQASDIPSLTLSKISDVTASAAELNIMDGVTVTASDINSVTSKIGLTDLSVDSGSTNYLGYDNTTGKFSAKVDTTVGTTSTNLVTSGAVQTAINNAISNVYKAQGTVAFASLPALSSSIEGYVYNISDAFTTTSDFVEGSGKSYPAGTNVVCINTSGTTYKWDVLAGTIDTSSFITASSTNTLTNKTIDADDNTISDLTTSNFKSGTIVTSIGNTQQSSNTAIPTEKAVANKIASLFGRENISVALTPTGGVCTYTVDNVYHQVYRVYRISNGATVITADTRIDTQSNTNKIMFNSSETIPANTYGYEYINVINR